VSVNAVPFPWFINLLSATLAQGSSIEFEWAHLNHSLLLACEVAILTLEHMLSWKGVFDCLCFQVWSNTVRGWKQESNDWDKGAVWVGPEATMLWGFLLCHLTPSPWSVVISSDYRHLGIITFFIWFFVCRKHPSCCF
jgi:hypothetical protein